MNPAAYLVLSAILFSTGLLGLIRRNALIAFMSVETRCSTPRTSH